MEQKEKNKRFNEKKGIESDKELLTMILENMDYKGSFSDFVERKKGNFSKMLSGKRKFTYDYIIAMEKIFKVPMAFIVEDISYEQKQFTKKGLQYVAITNTYGQFVSLGNDKNKSGSLVIYNLDEYGKTLIDYIIEYDAVEGVRYLYKEHQLKYCPA